VKPSRPLACALLGFALGFGISVMPATAQQAPATASSTAPHPWDTLSPTQRDLLAPLQPRWNSIPPRHQAHMLERAKRWATFTPEKRAAVRKHLEHWEQMTPDERRRARDNQRKFHELSPAQRDQLHETFKRFQQLPPAERDKLLREWRALPPKQRLRWSMPASAGSAPVPGTLSRRRADQGRKAGPAELKAN
jgi:hypothetical protein